MAWFLTCADPDQTVEQSDRKENQTGLTGTSPSPLDVLLERSPVFSDK